MGDNETRPVERMSDGERHRELVERGWCIVFDGFNRYRGWLRKDQFIGKPTDRRSESYIAELLAARAIDERGDETERLRRERDEARAAAEALVPLPEIVLCLHCQCGDTCNAVSAPIVLSACTAHRRQWAYTSTGGTPPPFAAE